MTGGLDTNRLFYSTETECFGGVKLGRLLTRSLSIRIIFLICDFRIDERVLSASFREIIVQPIIENAIYRGIKNRKEGGQVRVDVQLIPRNMIEVTVVERR